MSTPIAPRATLIGDPSIVVARVVLGLTIYTDDGAHWARDGAASLWDMFNARVHPTRIRWFRTSQENRWRRVLPELLTELRAHLTVGGVSRSIRHLWEVEFVDEVHAPSVAFRYRESDTDRSPGYAQLLLPRQTPADELLSLAIEVGHRLPLISAVGGYTASFSREHRRCALQDMYRLCKRHLALDIQEPDLFSHRAKEGIAGLGWLTLLGQDIASRVDMLAVSAHEDVAVMALSRATLVKAGELTLGDVNLMEWPHTLAAVGALLSGARVTDLPPLVGFGTPDWGNGTESWRARFFDPDGWV